MKGYVSERGNNNRRGEDQILTREIQSIKLRRDVGLLPQEVVALQPVWASHGSRHGNR